MAKIWGGGQEPTFCLKNNKKGTIFPQKSLKHTIFGQGASICCLRISFKINDGRYESCPSETCPNKSCPTKVSQKGSIEKLSQVL
jgi:hypothetical protein